MQCHITCGFSGHTVPALAIGNCLLSHVSLWLYPHPSSLPSDTTRYPRFILCILCPRSKISHFSKDPWFISFISSVRNPETGAGSAHYYWSVTVPRSSQWRDYEIYVSTLTCGCSHFSNYFCISPSIYMLCWPVNSYCYLQLSSHCCWVHLASPSWLSIISLSDNKKLGPHHLLYSNQDVYVKQVENYSLNLCEKQIRQLEYSFYVQFFLSLALQSFLNHHLTVI